MRGDDHRAEFGAEFGAEPICRVLPIAPATFYEHLAEARDPDRASGRAKRDAVLRREAQRVWDQNFKVYGVRKVWHQMRREGFDVAVRRLSRTSDVHPLTTVERLMWAYGAPFAASRRRRRDPTRRSHAPAIR